MSDRRQVWETLSNLLARVDAGVTVPGEPHSTEVEDGPALNGLEKEIRRLGKAQFKANALAENQGTRWEQTIASVQAAQNQQDGLVETLIHERIATRELELMKTVLPALDGLENAIGSGRRYLEVRDKAADSLESSQTPVTPAQAVLVSPADRAMLSGWLDGLRLVRERMLAILKAGDVTPIPTVGQPFDPYLHIAVGTITDGDGVAGTVAAEERCGYRSPSGVLRYAEVIVYQPEPEKAQATSKQNILTLD
ncbi:MAG: nucleotide exchange factor GrpE [Chloroflexi bacterium]|nr:nucleotide exchange factor GrpE [Chloroflexota bacterium]